MNSEKMRGYLYVAVILAVLAVGYAALSAVGTYGSSVQPSSYRSFYVTAQGKAIGVPDVAEFNFSVVTQGGKDLGSLQAQNTTDMNKAIAFVKSEGVSSTDIQTSGYNISPRYTSCAYPLSSVTPCPAQEIVGYTVTQNVAIKVRDFAKIGDILSGVVKNGANNVSSLNFTIDDPTGVEAQARAQAIVKAQAQAQAIAQEAGFSVGRLLSISTNSAPQPVYYAAKSATLGMGGVDVAAPSPTIEPGSQEVQESVTLQYEIR
ncbi:SIMPL domain-containing protein [Patescibacteria group bacterium]|nr:SIMPL domain-containing protein [Patescibacteria group bacterium]